MPEAGIELLLARLRKTAVTMLDVHVVVDGRCVVCRTAGVCPRAMLAANNLDVLGDPCLRALGPPIAPP